MPELIRLHIKLETEVKELYEYAHRNGHDIANIKNTLPYHINKMEGINKILEEMKESIEYPENSPAGRLLLADIKTATETGRRHEEQIDQLRKFMWITIGTTAAVNILIPIAVKFLFK